MIYTWDDYFMSMVYLVASRSKDRRTHIGAVVVGPRREVRSTGYNGFVRRLNDDVPERHETGEKHFWFEHAERNAIYNAGRSLEGCTMYTQGVPCMDCARGIVQSGIVEIVVDKNWPTNSKEETERNRRTREMLGEVRVSLREHEPKYMQLKRFNDGVAILLTD